MSDIPTDRGPTNGSPMNGGPREEDGLLEQLGELARRDEHEDAQHTGQRLHRLTRGQLSTDELEELRLEAERSDATRLDFEAFRPLGEEFHGSVLERLQGLRTAEEPDSSPWTARPRTTPQWWLAAAAGLTVAVLGLWLLVNGPGRLLWQGSRGVQVVEVASYEAKWRNPPATTRSPRGAAEEVPVFTFGTTFDLTLQPEDDLEPAYRLYLASDDGVLLPWPADDEVTGDEVTASGVVRVRGVVGEDLALDPGSWRLVFVYGPAGAELPAAATLDELQAATEGTDTRWRWLTVPFRIADEVGGGEGVPLEVRYAGCREVRPGPACEPSATVTVWARSAPETDLRVQVDDRAFDTRSEVAQSVDGGWRFTLPIEANPVASGAMEIRVSAIEDGRERTFRLALVEPDQPRWLDEARGWSRRDPERARRLLHEHADEVPEELLGFVLSLQAKLAPSRDEMRQQLEAAVEHHLTQGNLLQLAQDFATLNWLDNESRDFVRRLQHAETIRPRLAELPVSHIPGEATVILGYYEGSLHSDLGDFRTALEVFQDAVETSRRLNLNQHLRDSVLARQALVLQRLGRRDEAAELVRAFAERPDTDHPPCQQAELLNSFAWTQLFDGEGLVDPLPLLRRALESSTTGGGDCDSWLPLDLWLNLALAHTQRGETWEAHAALDQAAAFEARANALHHLWRLDIEGRLALLESNGFKALDTYADMERLAARAFDPQAVWWSKVQQAGAHELLGDVDAALTAYAEAERQVDQQSLLVPLAKGRFAFDNARQLSARRQISLLLDQDRVADAFDAARRSRARVLHSVRQGHRRARLTAEEQARWDLGVAEYVQQRAQSEAAAAEHWTLSRRRLDVAEARYSTRQQQALQALDRSFQVLDTQPPAPPPPLRAGELVLAFHPLAQRGVQPDTADARGAQPWVVFAARLGNDGRPAVESHRFDLDAELLADPPRLADQLLAPFRDAIDASRRLRILAHGPLQDVDVHALPWNGDVVLAALPVVYSLDLTAPASPRTPRRALVVGDPRGDLPAARREAEHTAALLTEHGYTRVESLQQHEATLAALQGRLEDIDLLHVAGHSVRAGRFGWDSALLLADDGRLTLGDVLALPEAPTWVVLSGCDSARALGPSGGREDGARTAGLGLAQAFLVAGSSAVVASLRPVGDRDTEALFHRFYTGNGKNLGERLRQAQLDWRRAEPTADWASFRLLEP